MLINRRAALIGAGISAAVPGLPAVAADTAASASAMQAPGFYRFRVGSFVVTTVNDGFLTVPVEGLVTNAPLKDVQDLLQASFLSPTIFHNSFTLTLVDTPRGLVMFDSGTGGQLGPETGKLAQNLRAAGLDTSRVATIVFSHFHTDHISGLLSAEGEPVFPNAEIVVPDGEWRFWTDASNETRSPQFQRRNFANVARHFALYQARVRPVAPGSEVVPGIHAISAPGHTPGHTMYRIADGGEQAIFIGDTAHRPELFVRRPDLHPIIDFDADLAESTRRKVLDMVATDRIRITGYHFPFPSNGYIGKDGSGYRFVPANWSSEV